jgi:hypothetical protein
MGVGEDDVGVMKNVLAQLWRNNSGNMAQGQEGSEV